MSDKQPPVPDRSEPGLRGRARRDDASRAPERRRGIQASPYKESPTPVAETRHQRARRAQRRPRLRLVLSTRLRLDFGGMTVLLISGTASIDENGKTVHVGDFGAQCWRT